MEPLQLSNPMEVSPLGVIQVSVELELQEELDLQRFLLLMELSQLSNLMEVSPLGDEQVSVELEPLEG